MRVHTGSGIGTSGNMTILIRRDPGNGSPLTDVGGAWMPAEFINIIYNLFHCENRITKTFNCMFIV